MSPIKQDEGIESAPPYPPAPASTVPAPRALRDAMPHLYQLRGDTRQASPQRGAAQRPEPTRATLPPGHVLPFAARSRAGPESRGG